MGAWGMKSFENDGAHDWLFELEESGLGALRAAFAVADSEAYLEVDEGQYVIAAAEVIAAARGQPGGFVPDAITAWLAARPDARPDADLEALIPAARAALDRITGADSEIQELWVESEHLNEWTAELDDLRRRLS